MFVYILGNITRRAAPALSRILKNQRGARRHCVNPSSSIGLVIYLSHKHNKQVFVNAARVLFGFSLANIWTIKSVNWEKAGDFKNR